MKSLKYNLRDWQQDAKDKLFSYWDDGKEKALLAACPGAGKTTFGVDVSVDLFNDDVCELVILIAPTVNVKEQWAEEFETHGFETIHSLGNDTISKRLGRGDDIKGNKEVICVTYSQLAMALPSKAGEVFYFAEYGKRYKLFLIGDEIHHADDDEKFGDAVTRLAEVATKTLALSGTPFNSKGGSLAMCNVENDVDDQGRPVLRAIPFAVYSYADALRDENCRLVEFAVVYGKAQTTYKSLTNGELFQKIVDLSRQNKSDTITKLLDIDGDFIDTLVEDGIKSLQQVKESHRDAGMLIVAQNKKEAVAIDILVKEKCKQKNLDYSTVVITNDTENASTRIKKLRTDKTDIVIAVRMISEGVDIKRLRVGVFATNWLTRMFFIQFIGRFARWQSDLPSSQFARIIIPAHALLMTYAREIEQMCLDSIMSIGESGNAPGEQASIELNNSTEASDKARIAKGSDFGKEMVSLVDDFRANHPSVATKISDVDLLDILQAQGYMQKGYEEDKSPKKHSTKWYRNKNTECVQQLARLLKTNGKYEGNLYQKINGMANAKVGISEIDDLVEKDVLIERHNYLKSLIMRVMEKGDL
jgi:superfamily II DNA or RNA helicase